VNWERVGLAVALVALVGTWVFRGGSGPRADVRFATPVSRAASASPSVAASNGVDDAACRRELAACEEKAWSSVADAIKDDVRERRDGSTSDAGFKDRGSSPADQQRELDDIARQHVRKEWKDKQTEILKSVRGIGTEEWAKDEIEKTLARFDKFGVDASSRAALDDGYRAMWSQNGPAMHEAINAEPPDVSDLLDEIKAHYENEDALVLRVLGPAALARFRAQERRGRTEILAIAATFADEDWDQAIAW
jgi:hypothetical protein